MTDRHVYVIMLNGPRGSGKDYIAERLSNRHADVFHGKFSLPMKHIVSAALGMSYEEAEAQKLAAVHGKHNDKSFVDLQIELWRWLDDMFGPSVLGKVATQTVALLCEEVDATAPAVVFSDAGRPAEVEEVINNYGADHCLVVRLHRKGHTFEGDIREYVEDVSCLSMDLYNDGTPEGGTHMIHEIERWLLSTSAEHLTMQALPKAKLDMGIALINIIENQEAN